MPADIYVPTPQVVYPCNNIYTIQRQVESGSTSLSVVLYTKVKQRSPGVLQRSGKGQHDLMRFFKAVVMSVVLFGGCPLRSGEDPCL